MVHTSISGVIFKGFMSNYIGNFEVLKFFNVGLHVKVALWIVMVNLLLPRPCYIKYVIQISLLVAA